MKYLFALLLTLATTAALADGTVPLDETYPFDFNTVRPSTGAPFTIGGTPEIQVYEEGSTTQITAGDTLTLDLDGITGLHHVDLVCSAANGYEVGKWYTAVIAGTTPTVDSISVAGRQVARFRVVAAESSVGVPKVDVSHWLGTAAATPTTAGVPEVDATFWLGGAIATPTVAGVPEVDVTHANGSVITTSGAVDANVTQVAGSTTAGTQLGEAFDNDGTGGDLDLSGLVISSTGTAVSIVSSSSGDAVNLSATSGQALDMTSSSGDAVLISATSGDGIDVRGGNNGHAINALGNGTGHGALFTSGSGATGNGITATAASTNGNGISATGSGNAHGLLATAGSTGSGATFTAGGGSGLAISSSGGNGHGIAIDGDGTGEGISIVAGTGGHGIEIDAGSSAGNGIDVVSQAGNGIDILSSGGNGHGIQTSGNGTGVGLDIVGGTTGHGLQLDGGTGAADLDFAGNAVPDLPISIRSNTAQAGAASTITLDASASSVTDFYKNRLIYLTANTGAGQVRRIVAYNGTTKVARVFEPWATTPDNTTTFSILPMGQ